MICPIDSEQRIPLRTDGRTHGRGESDNPPKFSIENCRGAIKDTRPIAFDPNVHKVDIRRICYNTQNINEIVGETQFTPTSLVYKYSIKIQKL